MKGQRSRASSAIVHLVAPNGLNGRGGIARVCAHIHRTFASDAEYRTEVVQTRVFGHSHASHVAFPIFLVRYAASLARTNRRPDLAHINVSGGMSTPRKIALAALYRAYGIPYVLHLHGSGYDEYYGNLSSSMRRATRSLFAGAAAVITLGEHWRSFVVKELGVVPEATHIVSNGTPGRSYLEHSLNEGRPVEFIFVGEIGPRKGAFDLIEAFGELVGEGLDVRLQLVGGGDVHGAQKRLAERGCESRSTVHGQVSPDKVECLLRDANVFVLPSYAENLPMALIEAMACSLPLISTPVGSIPELFDQKEGAENGFLIEPGDVDGLSRAMKSFVHDRASIQRMGRRSWERHRTGFSLDQQTQEIRRLWGAVAR